MKAAHLVASVIVFAAMVGSSPPALADDAACIAASEGEVALHEQQHFQQAMTQLVACASPTCPAVVQAECNRRMGLLAAAMPTVVFAATDAAGSDLLRVTVSVDGVTRASTLDGRALPIDPGSHTVRFEAAGKPPVEKTLVVREGEKDRHIAVVLGSAAPAPPPDARSAPWPAGKTLAILSGGVGVAGIAVGTVFGVMASSQWSTQQKDCGAMGCPDHAGAVAAHAATETDGAVSTAMFVVGAAGVAGAFLFWFTAPKETAAPALSFRLSPLVARSGGGVSLGGAFQ